MKSFKGRLAVITGGGTGMGRALAEQLSAEGCAVAMCDVSAENMAETKHLCAAGAPGAAVTAQHGATHIDLLFNNAGVGGGGSFVRDERAEWDRTFAICWSGVYYCTRAFLPLLIASTDAYIVNTSSVNG